MLIFFAIFVSIFGVVLLGLLDGFFMWSMFVEVVNYELHSFKHEFSMRL